MVCSNVRRRCLLQMDLWYGASVNDGLGRCGETADLPRRQDYNQSLSIMLTFISTVSSSSYMSTLSQAIFNAERRRRVYIESWMHIPSSSLNTCSQTISLPLQPLIRFKSVVFQNLVYM